MPEAEGDVEGGEGEEDEEEAAREGWEVDARHCMCYSGFSSIS